MTLTAAEMEDLAEAIRSGRSLALWLALRAVAEDALLDRIKRLEARVAEHDGALDELEAPV